VRGELRWSLHRNGDKEKKKFEAMNSFWIYWVVGIQGGKKGGLGRLKESLPLSKGGRTNKFDEAWELKKALLK